ncbi:MAG: AMP-binding protein [Candidatus Hydrogenedentes bacterium]|nr:AMP-binding protein [Candidatus Hydrogenedentota bacterium]
MGWKDLNLTWHYVEKWAAETPAREALVCGGERITWYEFKRRVDRAAKALLEAGVQRGDCVAMLSMARIEFMVTFMATLKIGARWLGLSPKFTVDELRYIVSDAQPKVLVTIREFAGRDFEDDIRSIWNTCGCIRKILVLGEPFEDAEDFGAYTSATRDDQDTHLYRRSGMGKPDDDALLMYTSGSTGRPKGVLHTHASIIANVAVQIQHFGFTAASRSLLHFPINHVAADVEIGFASVYAGATIVMMERFDPTQTLRVIEQEGVTVMGQIPAMFLMQMQTPLWALTDLSKVETFIWSGVAAPRTMVEALAEVAAKTGARLLTGYGSTEVAGFVTYTAPGDDIDTLHKTGGTIAPPFELKIVDERRQPLPQGEVGEIALRGPMMMKGYFNNPAATEEVLDVDGWYYTNDLARLDERGYIHICGRKSEMFKSGGENVYPREIEEVLEGHPGVLFSAVLGVPDPTYQEVGRAFVAIKPGYTLTEDDLRAYCKERLANFKVPRRFDFREHLPLLPTGKVNKPALKAQMALDI